MKIEFEKIDTYETRYYVKRDGENVAYLAKTAGQWYAFTLDSKPIPGLGASDLNTAKDNVRKHFNPPKKKEKE